MRIYFITVTVEISIEFPPKTKTELIFDIAIVLLGIYLQELKLAYHMDMVCPFVLRHNIQEPKYESIPYYHQQMSE